MSLGHPLRSAYLVGGGIASLAADAYLVRDGRIPGSRIHVLEEDEIGGSLDARGTAAAGFSMRGTRMYGAAYVLTHELLSHIPSLDDPAKSVAQDTLEFWAQAPWDDQARLVESGRIVDASAFGLSNKDRVDLIEFMLAQRGGARREADRRVLRRAFPRDPLLVPVEQHVRLRDLAQRSRVAALPAALPAPVPGPSEAQAHPVDALQRPRLDRAPDGALARGAGRAVPHRCPGHRPRSRACRRWSQGGATHPRPARGRQRRPRGRRRRLRHRDAGLDDGRFGPRLHELAASAAPAPQRRLGAVGAARRPRAWRWGYGLFADRPGDFVAKAMPDCTGAEILTEVFSHLGWQDELPALLERANCVPCLMPYATSQFMPRAPGDRPPVVPPGTVNLAFAGQYCEVPDDVVFKVEYSIHSAALAVSTLLGVPQAVPPAYQGLDHPNALAGAIRRILE